MFKAEHFDPATWARLFKEARAKYVVPVAEHHDGFAMYDGGLSDWTAAKMGPQRDVIGELAKVVRAEGLHFGTSSHRVEHNLFLGVGRAIPSTSIIPNTPRSTAPRTIGWKMKEARLFRNDFTFVSSAWADDWLARSSEIVEKYHPDIIYFDWWVGQPSIRPNLPRFAAFYYNASLKYGGHVGVINYKDYALQEHAAVLDLERGQLGDIRPLYWQTDTSISNKSWGLCNERHFQVAAVRGAATGRHRQQKWQSTLEHWPQIRRSIPDEVQQVLRDVGARRAVNGDAIYDTRPGKVFGEGPTRVAAGSFQSPGPYLLAAIPKTTRKTY
jgi:alpha-L-fucosidase